MRASIRSPSGKECDQDFSARASVLLVRSPSRNQCDPEFSVRVFVSEHQFVRLQGTISTHLFSLAGGEPGRRGDHFWVMSRVELNLEALACHPRTSKSAPARLGTFFFLSFHFSFSFSFVFFPLSKAVLPYKHRTCTAYYTSKDLNLKQYRTAIT